jgi:hypothetical protein
MVRVARFASTLAAALGIAIGLFMLFGPTYTGCRIEMTAPPTPGAIATQSPLVCGTKSLVEVQPIWPMPLLAILGWSLAPVVSLVGVRRALARRSPGLALVVAAVLVECTVVISFGAAPLYVPFVLLPLLVSAVLAARAARAVRTGSG